MNPLAVVALLGSAAFVVWYLTQPGGALGSGLVPGTPGAPGSPVVVNPSLTQEQLNYYLGGVTNHISGAQAAMIGASAGSGAAVATFGISIGVGALVGWFTQLGDNQTKEIRIDFAEKLGFPSGLGVHTERAANYEDRSKGLLPYLNLIGYYETLGIQALNIGKTDYERNTQWCVDVLAALLRSGYRFPR